MILDQDGDLSDADRAKRSWIHVGKQRADGMRPLRGSLDPEAGALWEAVAAAWAAPGMCNSDDESPCVDAPPAAEDVSKDVRSTGKRNHDAFKAGCEKWHCQLSYAQAAQRLKSPGRARHTAPGPHRAVALLRAVDPFEHGSVREVLELDHFAAPIGQYIGYGRGFSASGDLAEDDHNILFGEETAGRCCEGLLR
jgi:Domain of unknown function (DUF222)